MGPAIGNALAAIDGQIFRTTPPTHELVHHARPDLAVPSGDGGRLTITLPDDASGPGGRGGSGAARTGPAPDAPAGDDTEAAT